MRIVKFYRKPDKEDKRMIMNPNISNKEKFPLYALALTKKDAKRFKEERDMDKFIIVKDNIDESEKERYFESINKHPDLRQAVLTPMKLSTIVDKYTEKARKVEVELMMTETEYREVHNGDIDENVEIVSPLWWTCWDSRGVRALKQKYIDALDVMDFSTIQRFNLNDKFINGQNAMNDMDDWSFPDWNWDELAVFLYRNGWSFK